MPAFAFLAASAAAQNRIAQSVHGRISAAPCELAADRERQLPLARSARSRLYGVRLGRILAIADRWKMSSRLNLSLS